MMISKIFGMEPHHVFAVINAHGVRKACLHLKVGHSALRKYLNLHNHDLTPAWQHQHVLQHYLNKGYSVNEIAKQLHCNIDTVYLWMNKYNLVKHYRPWTEAEMKYLQFMAFQEPWPVIAEKLNRTVAAVQVRTKKLGIKATSMVGYTMQGIADDTHMKTSQVKTWTESLGLKSMLTATTKYRTIDPVDFHEWLIAGNVFRINDISKCAHWLKEIHKNAMNQFICSKELNFYAPKVIEYAARNQWPNRIVPVPLLFMQNNGNGRMYKRETVRNWLMHYRYIIPVRITNSMPNHQWWRDFVTEWDQTYIYKTDLNALINEYSNKIHRLQSKHGFPRSTDRMNTYFVRAEIIAWCHKTGMHKELLKHL